MNKNIFLIVITILVFCFSCSQKKDKTVVQDQGVSKLTVDLSAIEQAAKISAMFDINEEKAIVMLDQAKISAKEYKETITKIALDVRATDIFVEKKDNFKKQFQK